MIVKVVNIEGYERLGVFKKDLTYLFNVRERKRFM